MNIMTASLVLVLSFLDVCHTLQDKQELCIVAEIKVREEIKARLYLSGLKCLIKDTG